MTMSGAVSRQLPSSAVAEAFGEVNVTATSAGIDVHFTVLLPPSGAEAEGWQTGVALDASASMKNWFGRELTGSVPPDVMESYKQRGWVTIKNEDGRQSQSLGREAYQDAMNRGYLKLTKNIVQEHSRAFISYLAGELDADGGTTVIYWACGDGSAIEVVGDPTADECRTLTLAGPQEKKFGKGTQILPAVEYFVDRFADASRGMYVFLTDGRLDDLAAVKAYTTKLAREIAAGRRRPVKCVLIGVGSAVDERQMEELDDLDTGTDVDIWDHKIAAELRSVLEIFAEVVSESQIVAPQGVVYDPAGRIVKKFSDGVPASVRITLPPGSDYFELEVMGQRIRQVVA